MTQYNLGCLYSDTQRYEDSEKMYLSAMEIRRRLAVANPQVYEPDLADTQYNLGCLYYNINVMRIARRCISLLGGLSTAYGSESTSVRAVFSTSVQ